MVTQIQLGNIYQQNGKTVLGGGQSAIDTESLINSLAEAKRIPAAKLEDKIKINDSKSTAVLDLKDILSRLKDASNLLRNPPGVNNATSNIFAYRSTTLATNTGASADAYMAVTVEPGANIQSFSVDEIEQLARETKQNTGTFSLLNENASVVEASATAGFFTAGTFTLRNATGGGDVSMSFAAGDSLQTVVSKFNAVKDQTGIQATILKVADGTPNDTFKIVYTATKTGETYGFDLSDIGTVTTGSAVFDELTLTTTQTARNSKFTIDNVEVVRESNAINDVIPGMTFSLKQPTPALTTLSVNVVADTKVAKDAIMNFADIYNEFRVFFAKQTELGSDGLAKDTAFLSGNSMLRTVATNVATEISAVVAGLANGDPSRLSDLGIELKDFAGDDETPLTRNIMQINEEKLKAALDSDFDAVRSVFEYKMTSDNSNLVTFSRNNLLNATSMTLTISQTTNSYTASYVDKQGVTRTANFTATPITGSDGIFLKGDAGTGLDGLEFIFSSTADATVNLSLSQGIGDRLFNALDNALEADGLVDTEVSSIIDATTRYEDEITRIDEVIARYREQLQAQYAALESALSKFNNILQVLDAQVNAQNDS